MSASFSVGDRVRTSPKRRAEVPYLWQPDKFTVVKVDQKDPIVWILRDGCKTAGATHLSHVERIPEEAPV
jgi:hypothetical protein